MTKRIISALLCIIVLGLSFTATVSAAETISMLDKHVADVKLYADENVEVGTEFIVDIYVENITATNGIVSNDLPLYYDRDKLTVLSVECIFPEAWLPFADFFGHEKVDEYPYYLRSLPDSSDILTNPAYRITKSKEIGYKIKIKANKVGEAFVGIENDDAGKYPIMFVSIEDGNVYNYGGNGETIKINILGELPPDTSTDASEEVSAEISTDVSVDFSGEDVVSKDTVGSADANDSSAVASGDANLGDNQATPEGSTEGSEEISTPDDSKADSKKNYTFLGVAGVGGIILTALFVGAVIIAAAGIVVGVIIGGRKRNK